MSDDLKDFLGEIDAHQASTEKMRKLDPGGRWGPGFAYGAPKGGKVVRVFPTWMPSATEWERQSIEMHEKQAKEAAEFEAQREERIRREKLSAGENEIEIGAGADAGNRTSQKESRSGQHELDVIVI